MISIAERLKPFSHQPGAKCLIPSTCYQVEAFPTLIRISDLSGKIVKEIKLDTEGPLKQFTLLQDLERGCVTVFSETYSFHILPNLKIIFRKNPGLLPLENKEKLSLGAHKKQEWESIKKRCDFQEIFPIWHRLGSLLKLPERKEDDRGMFIFLKLIKEAVYNHRPEAVIPIFHKLFLAGFSQMLIPRLEDHDYQGILPQDTLKSAESPLYLLTEGSVLIRSLFLIAVENEISILPNLPPEFFCGRMVNLACPPYGTLDLEWSKKTIKSIHFCASRDADIVFHFPPAIRQFRLRTHMGERGVFLTSGDYMEIKSGSLYLLDQFQK